MIDGEGDDVEEKMTKFNKIHERIKFKAFGKVTIGKKDKVHPNIESDDKGSDDDKAKSIFEDEVKRAEEEIDIVNNGNLSKV